MQLIIPLLAILLSANMKKTILLTGATDGIGLETAKMLAEKGHHLLLHGRNPAKLQAVESSLSGNGNQVETFVADLSSLNQVKTFVSEVLAKHDKLDVLINNAGVFRMDNPMTEDGLDARFAVNTIAPYMLTKSLLPIMKPSGRVVNLSSAAQAPVDLNAVKGLRRLNDSQAYAESKLAIIEWTNYMAPNHPQVLVSVNPASMLGSKMVKEAFGVNGGDLRIGADILVRAALSKEFDNASGKYYDNDMKQFSTPNRDALNKQKCSDLVDVMDSIVSEKTGGS